VTLDVWLFGYHGVAQSLRQTLYDPLFILLMLGLVVLSAAFHEIGHATACRYGGARPGVMGAGIYIVWPAFYTDVTDAYRLGKGGRLRTDLGGVYFNVIFTLATAGAYFATGFEPLLLLIPLQHIEILHQFLPFIRLDGYYIVSDLTGVPDMFMRIKPTLKSLIPWHKTDESVTELKPWVRVAVTLYVLLLIPMLLFMLGMTVMNLPRVFATTYDSFLVTAHKLGHAGGVAIAVDVIQLVVLVLIPLGLVLTFVQLGRKAGVGAWAATEGRPAARAGLVLAGSAAAAFAAYTWIPASVYRPIQPGERGTLVGAVDQFQAIPTGRPALTRRRQLQLGGAPLKSKRDATTKTPAQTTTTQTTTGSAATTSTPTSTATSRSATTPTTTTSTGTAPAATTPAATTPTTTTDTTTTETTTMTDTTATP
jgi:putative peptide zinc metalloprotease protein